MIIYVIERMGPYTTHALEVESSDTIENIAAKIQEKCGIPINEQRLIWSGKQLHLRLSCSDYNITRGSTLELIYKRSPTKVTYVPIESPFPTKQEAYDRATQWKVLADQGDFDADTHIVDPHTHYAILDSLQREVVESSELYLRSGVYRLGDPVDVADLLSLKPRSTVPECISNLVIHRKQDGGSVARDTFSSLCETDLIIFSVLQSFDLLKSKQFCASFFSILVERYEGTVAEIVKIHRDVLVELKDSLEVAIAIAHNEGAELESAHEALMDLVGPAVKRFLVLLDGPQFATDVLVANTTAEMLNLLRWVACILDLGLVCYVGSHGSRFDTEYFQREMDPLRFDFDGQLSFDCSLRDLACLSGFLDTKSVWVFRAGVNLSPASPQSKNQNQKKLSILTTIDAFADLWGNVWAERGDQVVAGEKPVQIKKYHVSKGVIRRVREGADTKVPGAVKCHWYNWMQDYRLRFSALLAKPEDLTMGLNDKLLIGSDMRVNLSCKYSLQEYEMNYEDRMSSLGPKPSKWKMDSVTVGMQLNTPGMIGFLIQGDVKKIPETTIKQSIWQKWNFAPERANPGILNQYFGVQVSHCTGNAMRVPLKQILLMEPMQELLELQIPNWSSKPWGIAFQKALEAESNEAVFEFWKKYPADRSLVGQLVRCVLDVLDTTGRTDTGFRAAFVYQNCELGVDLDVNINDWTGLLRDSHLMATYAIVKNICLECRQPDHTTSICGDEWQYTVFQTKVGVKNNRDMPLRRLKIEPHSQTFKKVNDENVLRPDHLLFTAESLVRRAFRINRHLIVARELLDQSSYNGNISKEKAINVTLRASGESYSGMDNLRHRISLSLINAVGDSETENRTELKDAVAKLEIGECETENMAEPRDALSHMEIGEITKDRMIVSK